MIDWKTKLTSRKFWAAIAQFVAMMVVAFGGQQETATEVTALIMAGATVIAYIIGEGLIDAASAGNVWMLEDEDEKTQAEEKIIKPPEEADNG